MKRILTLVIAVIMLASMAVSVSAETNAEDSITIELTTDKAEYGELDRITATISVTNTSNYDATDVSLESIIPDGYRVKDKASMTIPLLEAGATVEREVVFVPVMADIIWIIVAVVVLAAIAVVVFFVFRGKKKKQVIAAVLCLAMVISLVPVDAIAVMSDMNGEEDWFDNGEFTPEVSTGLPTSTGWWITEAGNATLTEAGNVQVKDLRYFMTDTDKIAEDYTLEFKYQLPSGSTATVKLGEGNEDSKLQVKFMLTGGDSTTGDRTNLYDGSTTGTAIFGGEGEWHTVKVLVSNTNNTYRLYVDNTQIFYGADAKKVFAFMADKDLSRVTFQCTTGDMRIDDFKIYRGVVEPDINYYINEDFAETVTMHTGGLPTTTTWWISADGNATQDLTNGNVSVKDLRHYMTTPITGSWTMEFTYKLAAGAVAEISLTEGSHGESNAVAYLKLNGASASDGGKVMLVGPSITKAYDLEAEETHKLALCYANEKVALYIDGELLTTSAVSDGWFSRGHLTKTSVNRVTFLLKSGDSLVIDDVKLYEGLPENEEGPAPVEFDVSFDLNYTGAENAPAKITREEGATYGTLPTATREGYTFGGWYKDAACSGEAVTASTVVTETHTLYAKWTAVTGEPEPDSDYYIDEDFADALTMHTGGLPTATTWWISAADKATQDLVNGNMSVKDLRYYMTTPITDSWTMEFEYTLAAGAVAEISLTNGSHGEGNAVAYLRLNGADATYGGKINLVGPNITKTLDPDAAQSHKLMLCYAEEKVALYVDGELLKTSAVSDGWFSRGHLTKTSVNRVTFLLKSGDSLIVDDVKLYAGVPENGEEPNPGLGDDTGVDYSDEFTVFAPVVGTATPTSSGWWVVDAADAALTSDGNVQVKDLRYSIPNGITQNYTVEFKYQLPSGSKAKVVLGKGVETTRAQVYLNFTGGNSDTEDRVNLNKGNVTANMNCIFGGIGEWHTVQIAVNNAEKTYRMYVDGLKVTVASETVFGIYNEGLTDPNRVTFNCTTGDLRIDDFKIYLGEPEIANAPEADVNFRDDFAAFDPKIGSGNPRENTWWIATEDGAKLTEDGNVQVRDLRYYIPAGITKDYTVEFRYKLPKDGKADLKMGTGLESTKLQLWMSFRGADSTAGDRVGYYDGETHQSSIFDGEGEWHTVKLVVSNTKKTYRMYVDGCRIVAGNGNMVLGFYKDITTLNRISFVSTTGNLLIDDFKIVTGGPEHAYDPELASDTFTAPLIYEQTFDSWATGTFKSGKNLRWATGLKPGKGSEINVVPYNGGNIVRFEAEEEPEAYGTLTYTFAKPIKTDFTVEFRFRQPGGKDNPVGAQLSIQPTSGGHAVAGPDLRLVHNKDVYTLNGYNMTTGEAEEDDWYVIHVFVNMKARTYDVYANGMLMEEGIPFRNTNTATFNKLIIGHSALIGGVTEYDYIRIWQGQHIVYDGAKDEEVVDGFEKFDPAIVADREAIPSNYSDVNLSTRNIRSDGYKGHEGSLDILKQFMVTQDRWVYATNPTIVERVTEMGVSVQLSQSPNSVTVQGVDTDAKFYDGTEFAFAWLPAATNSSACLNNPAAFQKLLENAKIAVESGARSIQTDDAMFNYQYYKTGGCFCQHCMTKFTDYLMTAYTAEELAKKAPGVTINKNFNYRTYLERTYGWKTTAQYTGNRTKSPLETYFEEFQRLTTINYHTYMNEYLDGLGYGDISYSANIKSLAWGLGATDKINLYYSLFDGSMPETSVSQVTKENMVTASFLERALDRDIIWGVIPYGNYLTKLRTTAARSYALGVQILIPWDTYNSTPDRAWSSVDEVGDLFHFVRQYPYLFDDYEAPATVGVVMNMDAMTYNDIPSITNPLFNAGIPFKLLPTMLRDKDLNFTFDAEAVEGLEYIWEYSSIKGLPDDLEQAVVDSGAEQIQLYPLVAQKETLRFAWVENGTDTLYTSVRSYKGEIGAPTSVHVINDTGEAISDTVVGINRKYLPEGDYSVVLYRPGYDPVVLETSSSGRTVVASAKNTIKIAGTKVKLEVQASATLDSCVYYTVPEMVEWSILHIVPADSTEGVGEFQVSGGWSGMSVGTGLAVDDAISQNGSDTFTLTTSYLGLNVRTESDRTGSQDMLPFVYKNVNFSKVADYSLEAKVSADSNSGIMVREFPASNARFVALYTDGGKLMAAVRTKDNKSVFFREIMDVTEDMHLKIVKCGANFEFYASKDGENWGEKFISVDIVLDKPFAGVFAFSGSGESETSTISDVKLTELGINENEKLGVPTIGVDETIYVGDKNKLSITSITESGLVLTDADFETVIYTSSDGSVLTIDENNRLIGLTDGEAVLSVTATVGVHTVTAQMTVTVKSGGKVYIDENFDQWTPETCAVNWNFSPAASSTSNTYAFSASLPSDTDRSLGIMDHSIYQAVYSYVLDEPVTRNYSVEFDYYIETELNASEIGNLNTFYLSSSAGQYMTCLFYEKGNFKFFDNTLWHNICQVDVNQWVHIRIDINFDEQTNVFTITDSKGATTTASFAFRNASTDTVSLRMTTNTTVKGMTVYYDNLKMYLTGQ